MPSNRRVDAARFAQSLRPYHLAVQRLAHAEEALELVVAVPRQHGYGGDGVGVMGGKLREHMPWLRQQRSRRGEISHVGIHLAREHRVAGKPGFLRPFDLAVPIGALDQPDRNAAPGGVCHPA